ncbi:ribonuclease J [Rhodovibrionaceae bacterium A322]
MSKATLNDPQRPGADELLFLPLGGTGEIGMNLNLYGHDGKWLMVDLGVTFGEHDLPGIEVVMPDPDFIIERSKDLVGLVLTHAHEDHIGAVPWLWGELQCPVFATPFTASLLRRKLTDEKIHDRPEIIEIPLSGSFELGPFGIELISLTHSIPEPNALVIHTPVGKVVHTGDWKLDPDPLVGEDYDDRRLRELADEGVLAMVCDSTNALSDGHSGSELDVREALDALVAKEKNRVAIACFASNVARVETAMRIAENHGRRVALMGRSMHRIYAAAKEAGYLDGLPHPMDARDISDLPKNEVMLLCTGSQGEPRAALSRIASNDHDVELQEGDSIIFSSRVIPGNEKSILQLYNKLVAKGINVITDEQAPGIHVSGHPCRDELTQMYQWVKPRIAIPVHGEARHLRAHADLALSCQVQQAVVGENGAVIRLAPGEAKIVDHVHSGRLVLDGQLLRATDSPVLRSRRRMVLHGSATVTVVADEKGSLLTEPRIVAEGLYDPEEEIDVTDDAVDAVVEAIKRLSRHDRASDKELAETARLAARRVFQRELGKKPIVIPQVIRL